MLYFSRTCSFSVVELVFHGFLFPPGAVQRRTSRIKQVSTKDQVSKANKIEHVQTHMDDASKEVTSLLRVAPDVGLCEVTRSPAVQCVTCSKKPSNFEATSWLELARRSSGALGVRRDDIPIRCI